MAVTTSTVAYLLKRLYAQRQIENSVYKDNPLFAMCPKSGGFTGALEVHAVRYRDSLGRNPAFATAQTLAQSAAGATAGVQFLLTRVKNYQVYTLETEAILAGRDDRGSLLRTLTSEVDSALNNIGRDVAKDMYRDGSGLQVQATALNTLTLTVGEAVTNFEAGMTIVGSATKDSILLGTPTGAVIASVDRSAGTITLASNPDTLTATSFLYIASDRQTAAQTQANYIKISGMEAWNPATAPSAGESFFGADRSIDSTRLAGMRIDVSALNPEEGLVTALSIHAREGGDPDNIFMSYLDSRNIQNALGSKVETEYMQIGDIGFSTIRVTGPKGDVRIVPDQNCPVNVGRQLKLSAIELHYLGDMFNMLDLDGSRLSREGAADRFEGRISMYGNMRVFQPIQLARLVLPS